MSSNHDKGNDVKGLIYVGKTEKKNNDGEIKILREFLIWR